jgi:hypothetical protein
MLRALTPRGAAPVVAGGGCPSAGICSILSRLSIEALLLSACSRSALLRRKRLEVQLFKGSIKARGEAC